MEQIWELFSQRGKQLAIERRLASGYKDVLQTKINREKIKTEVSF